MRSKYYTSQELAEERRASQELGKLAKQIDGSEEADERQDVVHSVRLPPWCKPMFCQEAALSGETT